MLVGDGQFLFSAIASCTSVATFVSYLIPVITRLLSGVQIKPGPFNLGRWRTLVYIYTAGTLMLSTVRRWMSG